MQKQGVNARPEEWQHLPAAIEVTESLENILLRHHFGLSH